MVLTAIVCLLLFAGVLFLGMKNYEPEKSENPVQGVNSESSLKGYLGKGYAYAGSQEDASTDEESSFEEQAQILEDEPEEEPEEEDCRELVLFLLTDGAYRFVVRRRQIITSKRSTAIWRSPFS